MKKASVSDLRSHCSKIFHWVEGGAEVEITRRGCVVAKLVPAAPRAPNVDWHLSAALNRKPWSRSLTADESERILTRAKGF